MDADHRIKSPKHRLTCDSCKKSKVRCSQDRPVCSRCSRQRVECNYSLSRRAGRPRLNRSSSKHTPQRATQLASRGPLPPGPSSSPETANSNTNDSSHADSTASTDASVDGTDTGTDNSTNTTALTSTVDVELPSLSLGGLELQWDVPLSTFDCLPLDTTTTTPGVFDWNLDTIFTLEPPNTQPDGGLDDSIGQDARPAEESACSCAAELLDCLFQVAAELGGAEDGASRVLHAITASRRVLDVCKAVICCSRCIARWSTTLMLCQAADQIAIALDLGSVWTDSASPRYYLQADGLARENVPLRLGNYTVNGANRRLVLRSMLIRRLMSLQEVMDMARCALDALGLSTITPCEKALVGLVTEVFGVVGSKVDLVSTSF